MGREASQFDAHRIQGIGIGRSRKEVSPSRRSRSWPGSLHRQDSIHNMEYRMDRTLDIQQHVGKIIAFGEYGVVLRFTQPSHDAV